jgi:hypothetical protein
MAGLVDSCALKYRQHHGYSSLSAPLVLLVVLLTTMMPTSDADDDDIQQHDWHVEMTGIDLHDIHARFAVREHDADSPCWWRGTPTIVSRYVYHVVRTSRHGDDVAVSVVVAAAAALVLVVASTDCFDDTIGVSLGLLLFLVVDNEPLPRLA